jgi:hypothetical protein
MNLAMQRPITHATLSTPRARPSIVRHALVLSIASLTASVAACDSAGDLIPDSGGGTVEATFTSLYGNYFSNCRDCHTPNGPGRTSDTEQTLNFTSRTTALSALKTGSASGLKGNFAGCNGTPFITAGMPSQSLVVAVLDQSTRQQFDLSAHPDCDADAISDMTAQVGSRPSAAFVTALKDWITAGATDN